MNKTGIGNQIKELRQERKMTLQDVADKIDSSPIVISRYERGERKPNSEMIVKLANVFKVSPGELLNDKQLEDKDKLIANLLNQNMNLTKENAELKKEVAYLHEQLDNQKTVVIKTTEVNNLQEL